MPDAQLVVAGGGDDRARLEARAHALGIAEAVIFVGWVGEDALHQLYQQCALFVMPSSGDGFGMVFLEAMMHAMPCVGLRDAAAAEIFQDGASGVLVDRDNLPDMARRLSALLLDPARRKRLGDAGRMRYESHFRREHYSARFGSALAGYLRKSEGTKECTY